VHEFWGVLDHGFDPQSMNRLPFWPPLIKLERLDKPWQCAQRIPFVYETCSVRHIEAHHLLAPFLGILLSALTFAVDPEPCNWRSDRDAEQEKDRRRGKTRDHRVAPAPAPRLFEAPDGPRLNRFVREESSQFISQVLGRLVAAGRLLLQTLQADRFQIERHSRIDCVRSDRLAVEHFGQSLLNRFANKRRPARQQMIENRTQRIDVALDSNTASLAIGLFGWQVVRRAEHLSGKSHF